LGGDRPIIEFLHPNKIDHQETLVKQFAGMAKIPFSIMIMRNPRKID